MMLDNVVLGLDILLAIPIAYALFSMLKRSRGIRSAESMDGGSTLIPDPSTQNRDVKPAHRTPVGNRVRMNVESAQEIEDPLEPLENMEALPDLSSLKGVGPKYMELLKAAGLGNLKTLAAINPEELVKRVEDTNEEMRIVKQQPPKTKILGWHENAKSLLQEASAPILG